MTIKELLIKNKESRAILTDFASRERIHRGKVLDVNRFYFRLMKKIKKGLLRTEFVGVFKDLEILGYGVFDRERYFLPSKSLKEIGSEAIPHIPTLVKTPEIITTLKVDREEVVVLFKVHGLRCSARVPKDALEDFEKLVNI